MEENKNAKEIFEELGYEIRKTTNTIRYRLYDVDDNLAININFNNNTKRINIICESEALDMNDLKAINKQIEELGW